MKVLAKCFANFSKEGTCDYHGSTPHEIPDNGTVMDLVKTLNLKADDVKIVFVNYKEVPLDTILKEGDQVALAPKTGGM